MTMAILDNPRVRAVGSCVMRKRGRSMAEKVRQASRTRFPIHRRTLCVVHGARCTEAWETKRVIQSAPKRNLHSGDRDRNW